jgi:hypothetical protein
MSTPPVTFYLPKLSDTSAFDHIDPDTDWSPFRSARGQSIPHTYVRLRQAGHDVTLSNRPPSTGVVVVFAGDMRRYQAARPRRGRPLVVCVQTDRRVPDVSLADVIVQHNGLREDGRRWFFIPNWPQPGLTLRDSSRGSTVESVAFKGAIDNLRAEFLSPAWDQALAHEGLTFVIDTAIEDDDPRLAMLGGHIRQGSVAGWTDYSSTDVVLAVRPARRDLYRHKPAVKLVNAWRAGVPALLGPELAYREIRRTDLDYIEVSSLTAAADSLSQLRREPDLYQEMVENGRLRARAFAVPAIVERWESLLFETLPAWRPRPLVHLMAPATVPPRRVLRSIGKRVSG